MELLKNVIKVIIILAATLLPALPFVAEYFTFRSDEDKKISYKRFRLVVYTGIYVIAVTVALLLLKELVLWLEAQPLVQWVVTKIALSSRVIYCAKVVVAILLNTAIGLLHGFLSKFVRIGMKKRSLTDPKKKDGQFSWSQKLERKVVKFFYTETWFFVGSILKYLCAALSVCYLLVFAAYQVPAVFGASWIPYDFISNLFAAGYLYPVITLLALWQMYFFLEGIRHVETECPDLLKEETVQTTETAADLSQIDAEVRKQFKDFFLCELDLSDPAREEVTSAEHDPITEYIAQAVENDKRNPQRRKEPYLNCVDALVGSEKSLLINGSFFSEFSMYFLRYLSAVTARGDNAVFVCNGDDQIDGVYDYVKQGLAEISSLYCKGFQNGAVDLDDPIWRIVKLNSHSKSQSAAISECNILVTSLDRLCSSQFAAENGKFFSQLDQVVFVDTLKSVNTYHRQLAILNTSIKHVVRNNAVAASNAGKDMFRVRYQSRQVRYICFDDTRAPGLDRVLKNMLAVEFDSADAMYHPAGTLVRCYRYEGIKDLDGKWSCPHILKSQEELGALMNMAMICLAKGASSVTVFAEELVPYENIAETLAANMGQINIRVDGDCIRINKRFYNPDQYCVVIAMDSGDDLPAAVRKYTAMMSEKPALVMIFSRPYLLREYYVSNLKELWNVSQLEKVPVEEGTRKDIAQRILIKANAGGISCDEILRLARSVDQWKEYAKKEDINAILRGVLQVYGVVQEDRLQLFRYFEYTSSRDFDENGKYNAEVKIVLRKQGKLFDQVNGRDMVVLAVGDAEYTLPLPRSRLTQNYIAHQNLLYNGNIYYIEQIDAAEGRITAKLAVGGKNNEAYQYIQSRTYRVEFGEDPIETLYPTKHVEMDKKADDVSVTDAFVSVFRAPMEVLTGGYYVVDPHTLARNTCGDEFHHIGNQETGGGEDCRKEQTYRRYGTVKKPVYLANSVMGKTHLNCNEQEALMMAIRLRGQFGPDVNKTMALAAAMLNELLRAMFPSVADALVVCPVIHGELSDPDAAKVGKLQPRLVIDGDSELISDTDFQLIIIEDSATDLGVVSVLMSAGDDMLNTLFQPILSYLDWYKKSKEKDEYLYFGLDHEPDCFDFASVHSLAKLFGDDGHSLKFVDIGQIVECQTCDFCGKRYAKSEPLIELEDGRKMCKTCAENLVGNNKKVLKAHLERAKRFLESAYGITLDDDYEFCFESTVKITNTLKQNHDLIKRGTDAPLRAYVDDKKKVHVECSIPSVSLSELLVRELTHVWQLKHLPELDEDLAEGHIALVAIQYLRFLNQHQLASVRATYYESTGNLSGEGYRKLVRALLTKPEYRNNPFLYLLKISGESGEDGIVKPEPRIITDSELGLAYVPETFDRVLDGSIRYFYYDRLPANQQRGYDQLVAAISAHEPEVTMDGCTQAEIFRISSCIAYDRPDLFWFRNVSAADNYARILYGASAEETARLQAQIDQVVPRYLEGITDTMSAYDVALRLHVRMINAVDYDSVGLEEQERKGGPTNDEIDYLRSICGAFLEKSVVCEGYARAMQYLLQKCGIECAEIAGHIRKENGEHDGAHAWNILKVDGDYYYMDTTWDDRSNTVQTVKNNDQGFDYFCITTEELCRTRDVDLCPTDIPECVAVRANYYYHNDLVLDSYDLNKLKTIAKNVAQKKGRSITVKFKSKALYEQALELLCVQDKDGFEVVKAAAKVDKQINTGSYSYTYDQNIRTITLKLKQK